MSDAPPFFTRYGFSDLDPRTHRLSVTPYPEICRSNTLLATVVASAIDIVGGVCTREIAGVDATFTSDLSLRIAGGGGRSYTQAAALVLGRVRVRCGIGAGKKRRVALAYYFV